MEPFSSRSDQDLWQAARDGQLSAFGRLYRRHSPDLQEHVIACCGEAAPTTDIAIAAFLHVWSHVGDRACGAEGLLPALTQAVDSVVRDDGDAIIAHRLMWGTGDRSSPHIAPHLQPDPAADDGRDRVAALLYFGAGLPIGDVVVALQTTSEEIWQCLKRNAERPALKQSI